MIVAWKVKIQWSPFIWINIFVIKLSIKAIVCMVWRLTCHDKLELAYQGSKRKQIGIDCEKLVILSCHMFQFKLLHASLVVYSNSTMHCFALLGRINYANDKKIGTCSFPISRHFIVTLSIYSCNCLSCFVCDHVLTFLNHGSYYTFGTMRWLLTRQCVLWLFHNFWTIKTKFIESIIFFPWKFI
jgi:hypothetical protein